MNQISRREFVALASGVAAAPFARPRHAALTAQDVVDRIRTGLGGEWKPDTIDTFKAGDPATVATGIVTTAMATLDVLRKAVKAGANVVITCEPTFYGRGDSPTPPAGRGGRGRGGSGAAPGRAGAGAPPVPAQGAAPVPPADAVFTAKDDFIRKHQLVVFRLNEHWRLRRPDPFAEGLAGALGWDDARSGENPSRVSVPEIRLDALASRIKKALNARGGIRIVGARDTRVHRIGLLPGSTPIQASLDLLPSVDVIVAGEVREWEGVEYARDTVAAGERKGLILLGRILSEEPGMNVCAQWIRTIVPELTTTWAPVGDPYWRPL